VSGNDARGAARKLLDLAEDYFRDGFRRDRAPEVDVEPAAGAPPAPTGEADAAGTEAGLQAVALEIAACTRCALARTRKRTVPGEGAPAPLVLVVGEGPGADEDESGRPFVGAAGRYLDKWLAAVDLDRKASCFIANVVKCRPPGNRDPELGEVQACRGYLERQVDLLRPVAILALGRHAAQALTGSTQGITILRSRAHEYRGIPLVATFHPSAVLRDNSLRAAVWEDLKRLKALLGNA
jgi:uracil-DNA glycosylase